MKNVMFQPWLVWQNEGKLEHLKQNLRSIVQPYGSVSWSVASVSKDCGFDSQSGHIPTRFAGSILVRARTGGKQLMLLSSTDVSLSLPLSLKPMKKTKKKNAEL